MKIWVDDVRPAPKEYIWVKTVSETRDLIDSCFNKDEVILISLDHDAGDKINGGGDYIEILKILEQLSVIHKDWRKYLKNRVVFHIHSMNPVGRENMHKIIEHNNWSEIS